MTARTTRHGLSLGSLLTIVTLCGALGFVVYLMVPSVTICTIDARISRCLATLHHVGLAMHAYAKAHEGQFAPELALLEKQALVQPGCLRCPDSDATDPHSADYVLIPGQQITDAADNVLAYECRPAHRDQKVSVLFVDGRVERRRISDLAGLIQHTLDRICHRLDAASHPDAAARPAS